LEAPPRRTAPPCSAPVPMALTANTAVSRSSRRSYYCDPRHTFGFHLKSSLAAFDACPMFTALGDAVVTGPTGHNLRDLRLLLADNT